MEVTAERARIRARRRARAAAVGTTMAMLGSSLGLGAAAASASPRHQNARPNKQQLRAAIHSLMGHPKFTPPGPPLDVRKLPRSTKVVVIDNTPGVGPLQQAATGALQAARAAGFTPKLINGGANNTASDDINLLEQAVNLHPAIVLQVGILTPLETAGLRYAKAHHVPVIAVDDNQPKVGAPGEGSGPLTAGTAQEFDTGLGRVMAEYVGANGPANATIGMITTNDIVPSKLIEKGFTGELHRVCPHCTVIKQNVDTANWTTQITSTVTSMLDAHPTMNYLFPVVDGMAPWLTPAIKARPHRPNVISVNATPGIAMAAVKSGLFRMEAGTSAGMIGWYAFDSALRVLLHRGQQTRPQEPMTVFTTSEMRKKKLDPNSDKSLFGTAYEAGFKKLWGVH